ncbi:DUF2167 domain-containing protein [Aurantiacibacter marinus]|uniref:DUF2167 domain-containing protein n=1 Tax=Aurantiacibacter marinus TaxID=874156 RepID=A0A0H0XNL5_9SPHN|nr:DUF2167 domain-containing protein [Aurantiacibacter marinus]KLI63924.1 hypothetical protein AAV99_09530 [Aurantiacibacter marinus]
MRRLIIAFLALVLIIAPANAQPSGGDASSLSPETGRIALTEADAVIDLGSDYRFYGPSDAHNILVNMWGNPPSEAEGVLGIIMPANATPDQRSWGAIITWEPIGWVASDDARGADYDGLLAQMQADTRELNAQRRANGFAQVQVMGWAQEPQHDSVANTVSWARELRFFDGGQHTLHYDLRLLGRYGVLSMNAVGEMDQLAEIRAGAIALSRRASFNPGARYTDFDENRDMVAGYGVAGLVATGAGVAVAKNVGVLALLLKLAQPIGIALLVLAAALVTPFRKLFRRKTGQAPATR